MSFIVIAIIVLGAGYLLSRRATWRRPWYVQLFTKSSRAIAQHRQEMRYIASLLLKYAYEKGSFTREDFLAYVPGIADCPHCLSHVEMAFYTLIASNRLYRREGTKTYQLTKSAKDLLEYIDENPGAHADTILPISKIYYHHNAVHAGHNHLLQ